ncbi:hypothetical protein [Shewanella surugensis]|uniref:Big-1 domain-containing protein n=1 Tax=Shewanella surugensis TaxID=212020 RepID=A0ABT0LHB7_9GAMM|nr:hypothetical protein [Shewanella surugensis]MCL1126546.1 hypothetical protein [Shewanella surugensis]
MADDKIGQGTVTFTATGPSATESTLTLSTNAVSNSIDNGDGTYTFDLTSSVSGSHSVSVSVDGTTLGDNEMVNFTSVDVSKTTMTPDPLTIVYVDPGTTGSVTVSLFQADDSLVGHGGHTISFTGLYLPVFITYDGTVDHDNGTYTATFTCLGIYPSNADITVSVDTIESNTFQIDCD